MLLRGGGIDLGMDCGDGGGPGETESRKALSTRSVASQGGQSETDGVSGAPSPQVHSPMMHGDEDVEGSVAEADDEGQTPGDGVALEMEDTHSVASAPRVSSAAAAWRRRMRGEGGVGGAAEASSHDGSRAQGGTNSQKNNYSP